MPRTWPWSTDETDPRRRTAPSPIRKPQFEFRNLLSSPAMLSRDFLREHPDEYREALRNRGAAVDIEHYLALEAERRRAITEVEALKNRRLAAVDGDLTAAELTLPRLRARRQDHRRALRRLLRGRRPARAGADHLHARPAHREHGYTEVLPPFIVNDRVPLRAPASCPSSRPTCSSWRAPATTSSPRPRSR
jgi:hypothetical protein